MVLAFTFRSTIYLKMIFVYNIRQKSIFIFSPICLSNLALVIEKIILFSLLFIDIHLVFRFPILIFYIMFCNRIQIKSILAIDWCLSCFWSVSPPFILPLSDFFFPLQFIGRRIQLVYCVNFLQSEFLIASLWFSFYMFSSVLCVFCKYRHSGYQSCVNYMCCI